MGKVNDLDCNLFRIFVSQLFVMQHLKIIISTAFLLFGLAFSSIAQSVDVNTFENGMARKEAQILDVRTPEEFNQGHLSNAMHANWNEKDEFIRRIEALDKDEPVYIYCLSGRRSAEAANLMREKGFSHVTELQGGINAWKQGGKHLEAEAATGQISSESYQTMLTSASLVLVDFGAAWCPPCRKMEPILQEVEKKNPTIPLIRIDAGSQTALMKANDVLEIPTFILYKEGKEVWRASGLMEIEELNTALKVAAGN
jgi:rhodanese-related sulfurtransferase